MKVDYDKRFDTLYIAFADKSNSYGDDSADDIILMRDIDSDQITGVTVLSFRKKYQSHTLPQLPKSLGISLEKDVAPIVKM